MMNNNKDLIDFLRRFNRKERFFLIGAALGNEKFTLGKDFKKNLEGKLGIQIEGEVFTAMDYHLDWIYVSLKLYNDEITIDNNFVNIDGQINKNQEDIDLIVAFKSKGQNHIVLIEAKGETGWTNKQMDSKVKRFREMFGDNGTKLKDIIPHFYLVSPREPKGINKNWPEWMRSDEKPNWMKLHYDDNFLKVTRCDKDGKNSEMGEFCRVRETNKIKEIK